MHTVATSALATAAVLLLSSPAPSAELPPADAHVIDLGDTADLRPGVLDEYGDLGCGIVDENADAAELDFADEGDCEVSPGLSGVVTDEVESSDR